VSFDDWLLALHLLSAFALVGAMTIFSILVVAGWREERPRHVLSFLSTSKIATVLVSVGSLGTLVFGVWLAFSVGNYDIWDGWIIAAIVLWAVGTELGRRSGVVYAPVAERARELLTTSPDEPSPELGALLRSRQALWLHIGASVAVLAVLALMIWKPGA
jgi:uncharacterized membrane protein